LKDPWFPLLLMLTVVLAAWLGILGSLPAGVSKWVHEWQSLIAASIAIGAAALAYSSARRQLAQNDKQERNRRVAKSRS
jgi:membrane protein implicated in regulation of membrane protease activity